MAHMVGEVARLAGVTVRTLHHYDEIGLVVADRAPSGHRAYDTETLERLQQVMFFKELEFPLEVIKEIMSDPAFDRRAALLQQRELLFAKLERLRSVLDAIDLAMAAHDEGTTMTADEMFDQARYDKEVQERWGTTAPYRQSQERTKALDQQDWIEVMDEARSIGIRFADLKRAGASPTGAGAVALAEEHRLHINRFYDCSPEMHAGLADMYVADARFTEYWEDFDPGLTGFVNAAIHHNAVEDRA